MNVIYLYRIAHWLYNNKIPILPKLIYFLQFLLFNSSVPPQTKIGRNTVFAYGGIGTVIHARAIIGKNCAIGQGITIGGKSRVYGVPKIGDFVYIGAGVRILGDITIGNNVIIGANSVVVKDIPDGCIVAGVPAKIIKEGIIASEYESMP
jgi:serine O-acetyltransferase